MKPYTKAQVWAHTMNEIINIECATLVMHLSPNLLYSLSLLDELQSSNSAGEYFWS